MSDDATTKPEAKPMDALTAAYVAMVQWLLSQAPRKVGRQAWAAKQLKISPQHLSNIMNGSKVVGQELADRATHELHLDPDYFGTAKLGGSPAKCAPFLHRLELPLLTLANIEAEAREILRDLANDRLTPKRAKDFVRYVRHSDLVQAAILHAEAVESGRPADGNAAALASIVLTEVKSVLQAHDEK